MEFHELPNKADELGERWEKAIQVTHVIGPAAEFIARNLHTSNMLRPGEKWTLVMAMSCGFHLEIEMRLHHMGKCGEEEEEQGPKSESATIFGVREDGIRIPFPSESIMKNYTTTTIPDRH